MINVAIVEDEPFQTEQTQSFLTRFGEEKGVDFSCTAFPNGNEILQVDHNKFDLILMDIDMPLLNGMETSKKIRETNNETSIVFITNMANHAVNGYKVRALDFMVKPLTYADFKMTMSRFLSSFEAKAPKSVVISVKGVTMRIDLGDILYLDMDGHDVNLVKNDGTSLVFRGSMKSVNAMFPGDDFFQITSGSIVNLNHLTSFIEDSVILDDGTRLPVSRSRKKELLKAMTRFFKSNTQR